jgi:probable metal-binding protein
MVVMNEIHGHEVMQMMLASGKTYTRESLAADISAKFGASARFYTCSAENLTAEGLISFLEARGKFVPQGQGFQTSADLMCQGDHSHEHAN